MSVRAVSSQNKQEAVPTNIQSHGRYSTWLPRIAGNLNKLVIPILSLLAMASLPQADAGPMAYGICVEACFTVAGWWCPPMIPVCIAACLPILTAPSP